MSLGLRDGWGAGLVFGAVRFDQLDEAGDVLGRDRWVVLVEELEVLLQQIDEEEEVRWIG